jgi:hypothetical protein
MKMILESAQLLCTTFQLQGIQAPYRCTHQNHPTAGWTRESKDNFEWCIEYCWNLVQENEYRYGRIHKSFDVLQWVIENKHKLSFPSTGITPFALAMPDCYKCSDPIQSYRNYYNGAKQHLFKWTAREIPDWVIIKTEV